MARRVDREILESLKQLNANMVTLSQINQSLGDKVEDLNDEQEDTTKNTGSSSKSLLKVTKDIPIVGKVMKTATAEITKTFKAGLDFQKSSLGRGLTLQKAMQRQSTTTEYLTSNFTGYTNALNVGFDLFEAGIKNNNEETARLALATQLTGGNSKKLLKEFQQLNRGTGLTNEQQTQLTSSMLSLSQQFGMTTEELMGSIASLEKSMNMYAALNIGADVQEAGLRISAALGQEMGTMGTDFLNSMLQGSNAVTASILGVSRQREALLRKEGDATQNAFDLLVTAGKNSQRLIDSFTKGARDPAIAMEAAAKSLGQDSLVAARIYKQLETQAKEMGMSTDAYIDSVRKQKQVSDEFKNTWGNFVQRVWSPIQNAITKVATLFLKLVSSDIVLRLTQAVIALSLAVGGVLTARKGFAVGKAGLDAVRGKGVKGIFGDWWKKAGEVKARSAAGEAATASPAGRAGGGFLSGLGGGLKSLGGGLKAIGSPQAMKGALTIGLLAATLIPAAFGFKMFGDVPWEGVLKGTVAIGVLTAASILLGKVKGQILSGSVAILALGASLIPLAYSFNLIKGVGVETMFGFAGALVVLGAAAAGASFLLPLIGLGSLAFAALGASLLPLAAALNLASKPFLDFVSGLTVLDDVDVIKLGLVGPALASIAVGMAALSAGGLISSLVDGFGKLFGAESPVEKIVKLGNAAEHINKLKDSLKGISDVVELLNTNLKILDFSPLEKQVNKIKILDFSPLEKIVNKVKTLDFPTLEKQVNKVKTSSFQLTGINEFLMPSNADREKINDPNYVRSKINKKSNEISDLEYRLETASTTREFEMWDRLLNTAQEQLHFLQIVSDNMQTNNNLVEEGNTQRNLGNQQRAQANNVRPSTVRAGAGGGEDYF